MDNLYLAKMWNKIADLIEIIEENPYRAIAYRRGARSIRKSPIPLEELYSSGELGRLPGLGKSLQASAEEFLKTGTLALLAQLEAQVGDDLVMLMNLGISPKLVGRLHRELAIENISALDCAIRKRKVRTLRGIGPKGEQELKRALARAQDGMPFPAPLAEELAGELCNYLQELPEVDQAQIAGSIRLGQELAVASQVVVATSLSEAELQEYLSGMPNIAKMEAALSLELRGGLAVRIIPTSPEAFFRTLWQETGPKKHIQLVEELGLLPEHPESEEEIYLEVGLPYIPPESRWGRDELDLAKKGSLPKLSADSIRGDLHVHSNWSDGIHTLSQLQAKGKELGYEYLGICDHSKSLGIAGGLSEERLRERNHKIDELNEKGSCKLLKGIELEIKGDGQLDYSPEILSELDLVVGAIHLGFGQSQDRIMERLRRALSSGAIFILAHPTGRLLARRDPLPVDIEELLELAVKYNVILELNANPERLDLGAENLRLAKNKGLQIAINTDAHRQERLGQIRWALKVAARAGLEPGDIINTLDLASIKKRIEMHKGGR